MGLLSPYRLALVPIPKNGLLILDPSRSLEASAWTSLTAKMSMGQNFKFGPARPIKIPTNNFFTPETTDSPGPTTANALIYRMAA